jgi:hypothetical protein
VVKGQNEVAPHPRGRRVAPQNRTFWPGIRFFWAGSPKQTGPSISAWPCLELELLLNFPKQAGSYVKDKASNLVAMRDKWAVLDASD